MVVLFLILAIFLSGCGKVTDEEKVRDVIDEYFLAVTGQDWDRAKSYCIHGSKLYCETCNFEDHIFFYYPDSVYIIFEPDIFEITINDDFANAYIDGERIINYPDGYSSFKDYSGRVYLQKISNDWKLDYEIPAFWP